MNWMVCILLALAARIFVSMHPYSGENNPPMFGDFEAQRHWMEITINLPLGDWYRQTPNNDLQYWGLDYPPLTAYLSWIFGKVAAHTPGDLLSPLVALGTSRGHETVPGKIFMRSTVWVMDILILLPALGYLAQRRKQHPLLSFLVPSLLLIDHGHFQYNGVCIGLTLSAALFLLRQQDIVASVLFCLSLNFKQMALYYSPVFFFALLRRAMVGQTRFQDKIIHLIKLALTVLSTFAALWLPFCVFSSEEETCMGALAQILHRQFPFSRGIFEDKVANIWYSLSVLVDFRVLLSASALVKASLCLTLCLLSPTVIALLSSQLSVDSLLLALINSALAFFLASFQVHEKSLLLALVPAVFFVQGGLPSDRLLMGWFQVFGCFTMFPLLQRDGLVTAYVACNLLFIGTVLLTSESDKRSDRGLQTWGFMTPIDRLKVVFVATSSAGAIVLHAMQAVLPPPQKYPHLYPALISMFGAGSLCVFFLFSLHKQYQLQQTTAALNPHPPKPEKKNKKL